MQKISDEILNYLLDNSESMISIVNDEMRYVHVNQKFCESFNKTRNDLIGRSPSELWGVNTYREKIRNNIERSLKGEEVQYRAHFDVSGSSGRFFEVTYMPFTSSNTRLNYAIIQTRDLSAAAKDETHPPGIESKYGFMDKYLPFGVFSCNKNGAVLEANDIFYTVLEIKQQDRKKANLKDHMLSDHRFLEYIKTGKQGESGTFGQVQMVTADGKELFARISSHISNDNIDDTVIDGVLEDITREVILEKRLSNSQKLETLGTLTGGVAHDFNTILTTIAGYSDMAMQEVDKNSVIYDYMTKLKSAVDKAGSIIDQMLVFSKQLDQHIVPVQVDRVVNEAVEFMHSSVPDNIRLETELEVGRGIVSADPTQLFRVFINLMTNAIHAMKDDGGVLKVILGYSITDYREYADIKFSDTGIGIDPSIIDRIFEPFFTTRDVKGTGMGLAVSHGIITGIGGEINVESMPGRGSVFTVRIPLAEKHSQPEKK